MVTIVEFATHCCWKGQDLSNTLLVSHKKSLAFHGERRTQEHQGFADLVQHSALFIVATFENLVSETRHDFTVCSKQQWTFENEFFEHGNLLACVE